MTSPDGLEQQHTLSTATSRYDELRMRDALAAMGDGGDVPPLSREESLELLGIANGLIIAATEQNTSNIKCQLLGKLFERR